MRAALASGQSEHVLNDARRTLTAFANGARNPRAGARLSLESQPSRPEAVSCRRCRSNIARAFPAHAARARPGAARGAGQAGVEVEVRGVDEDIRANVLAYLSFERYKNSDDLSPEFVERLQERSEREVRARDAPLRLLRTHRHVGGEARRRRRRPELSRHHQHHARQTGDRREGGREGHGRRARPTSVFTDITGDLPIQPGDRLNHANYEQLKGGLLRAAATYGYLDARMVRNEMRVDPQALARAGRHRVRNRRALPLRRHHHQAGRHRRRARAAFPALPARTSRSTPPSCCARSSRSTTASISPPSKCCPRIATAKSTPFRSASARNPTAATATQFGVGYGTDTEVRGTVAWEDRRINQRGHRFRTEIKAAALDAVDRRALHRADRRSGHRKVHAAAHRRTRAPRRHRRPVRQFHCRASRTCAAHWFGEHWLATRVVRRVAATRESEFIASNGAERRRRC